jgi:hypothetical protein
MPWASKEYPRTCSTRTASCNLFKNINFLYFKFQIFYIFRLFLWVDIINKFKKIKKYIILIHYK